MPKNWATGGGTGRTETDGVPAVVVVAAVYVVKSDCNSCSRCSNCRVVSSNTAFPRLIVRELRASGNAPRCVERPVSQDLSSCSNTGVKAVATLAISSSVRPANRVEQRSTFAWLRRRCLLGNPPRFAGCRNHRSCSHGSERHSRNLFFGLPTALFVLILLLSPEFHSAAFLTHRSGRRAVGGFSQRKAFDSLSAHRWERPRM